MITNTDGLHYTIMLYFYDGKTRLVILSTVIGNLATTITFLRFIAW